MILMSVFLWTPEKHVLVCLYQVCASLTHLYSKQSSTLEYSLYFYLLLCCFQGTPDFCCFDKYDFDAITGLKAFVLFWRWLVQLDCMLLTPHSDLMPMFFLFYLVFFVTILHRDSVKPNSLYFSLHLQIAWPRSFPLCQFVALVSWFSSSITHWSVPAFTISAAIWCLLFVVAHICLFLFEETACLFSFKWPLNSFHLYLGWTTPPSFVKGHVSVHRDIFFFLFYFVFFVQCCRLSLSF